MYPYQLHSNCRLQMLSFWSCPGFVACLTLSQTSPSFYVSAVQVVLKRCGKGRNCSKRAISPFPSVFSTCLYNFLPSSSNSNHVISLILQRQVRLFMLSLSSIFTSILHIILQMQLAAVPLKFRRNLSNQFLVDKMR